VGWWAGLFAFGIGHDDALVAPRTVCSLRKVRAAAREKTGSTQGADNSASNHFRPTFAYTPAAQQSGKPCRFIVCHKERLLIAAATSAQTAGSGAAKQACAPAWAAVVPLPVATVQSRRLGGGTRVPRRQVA